MHDAKLSKLFDRYRVKGDLAALAEVFDEVSPELLRVARHVAGRGSDPEDLVQATFLAAIERAMTFDAERALVPWLMGILINQSRLAKRRMRGSHLEAEDDVPAATLRENDAESHEIDEAVSRALDDLPETYREVLVPHLSEGKKPHEIARDLGRPQGTVRAQIHRGLRLVRRSLPSGFALGVLALLGPNALAAVRARVLERAEREARDRGHDPNPASIPPPPGTLRPKLVAAGVTALVGVAAWLAWTRSSAGNEPEQVLAASNATTGGGAATVSVPASGDERAERTALAPIANAPNSEDSYGSVAVRVVRTSTHVPAVNVNVTLLAWGEPRWFEHVVEARTDADGMARFARVHAGRVGLNLDGGAQVRDDVVAGRETRMEAALEPGIEVHAVVVDERGSTLSGAVLEVYAERDGGPVAVSAPSGPDGTIVLKDVDRRRWIAARAAGRAPSASVWLGIPTRSTSASTALELRLGDAGPAIDGLVVDDAGTPVQRALVRASASASAEATWRSDGGVETGPPATFATCDARGRFRFEAIPRGSLVLRVEAPGFAAQDLRREGGDAGFVTVRLQPGARVLGRVAFADGSPAAHAEVEIASEDGGARTSVRADVQGSFELAGLRAGTFTAVARAGDVGPETTKRLVIERGSSVEWNAVVEHPRTIEGIALGEDGRPLKAWLVFAVPEEEPATEGGTSLIASWARVGAAGDAHAHMLQCWTAPDGRFSVPCRNASLQRLELRPRAAWRRGPYAAIAHVAPGTHDVVLRGAVQHGWIEGRVVDGRRHAGDPPSDPIGACTIVAISRDAAGELHTVCDAVTGQFELEILPGSYELLAWPEHGCVRRLVHVDVARDERVQLGDLVIAPPGSLRVANGGQIAAESRLEDACGLRFALSRAPDGSAFADGLPPGTYWLTVHGRAARELTVRSNETTTIQLERE